MPALHDIIKAGSEDYSATIHIMDASDGSAEEAVEHNTSGLALWYRRKGAAKVAITPVALSALTDAHSDGGIEHIDDGDYRLDLPDAAVAAGSPYVDIGGTVTGMIVIPHRIRLVDVDLDDADIVADDDDDTIQDIGVRKEDSTFYLNFKEANGHGPVDPDSVTITVYKNGSTTEIPDATGITGTIGFASNTGLVQIAIDTSDDTGKSGWWEKDANYLVKVASVVPASVYGGSTTSKDRYFRFTLGDSNGIGDNAGNTNPAEVYIPVVTLSYTTTAGTTLHMRIDVYDGYGRKVDVASLDAAATASIEFVEHSSDGGAAYFTHNFTAAKQTEGGFEDTKTNPGFNDDRQLIMNSTVTINGTAYNNTETAVVLSTS